MNSYTSKMLCTHGRVYMNAKRLLGEDDAKANTAYE